MGSLDFLCGSHSFRGDSSLGLVRGLRVSEHRGAVPLALCSLSQLQVPTGIKKRVREPEGLALIATEAITDHSGQGMVANIVEDLDVHNSPFLLR